MTPPEQLQFGPFTVDCATLELWRDTVRIPLEPLPTRVLLRLARDPGALVSRRELLALGWGNAPAVTDQSLNTCVHEIRLALSRGGSPVVRLETLRGRGYRLIVEHPPNESQATPPSPGVAWPWIAGIAAVVAAAVTLATVYRRSEPLPIAAQQYLDRARYLQDETQDFPAARAVLDSARSRFPQVAALHAEWSEVSVLIGELEDARRGAESALRMDARQVAAHRVRGMLALIRSDWVAADSALEHARLLSTNDTRTLAAIAFRRLIEGRFADADREMRSALALDPLSVVLRHDAGFLYLIAGRYAEAEHYCRETLRFKPHSVWAADCLFDVAVLTRRTETAAYWGRRLLRVYDAAPPPESVSAMDAVATTEAWRLAAWVRAVDRGADPFGLAVAYAANGRIEESLRALHAAAQRPTLGLLTIAVDPRLAILRDRPAFKELLQRLKLTT